MEVSQSRKMNQEVKMQKNKTKLGIIYKSESTCKEDFMFKIPQKQ